MQLETSPAPQPQPPTPSQLCCPTTPFCASLIANFHAANFGHLVLWWYFFGAIAIAKTTIGGSIAFICCALFVVALLLVFIVEGSAQIFRHGDDDYHEDEPWQRDAFRCYWLVIYIIAGVAIIVLASVGAGFADTHRQTDVSRVYLDPNTTTSASVVHMSSRFDVLVIPVSSLDWSEQGQYISPAELVRVYRMGPNITSAVLVDPLLRSADNNFWLRRISVAMQPQVNAAIANLRLRYPNTTLQEDVLAFTGTTNGTKYFQSRAQLDAVDAVALWLLVCMGVISAAIGTCCTLSCP